MGGTMHIIDLYTRIEDGSLENHVLGMAPQPEARGFQAKIEHFLAAVESYKTMAQKDTRKIGDTLLKLAMMYREHQRYDGAKQIDAKVTYWLVQDTLAA